ncbi:MAG: citrate (Si)-synthase [Alphaproteobacteria bacterium]|nr:citrate (Si)-synthase [Alphaproteobacteria bacterium]
MENLEQIKTLFGDVAEKAALEVKDIIKEHGSKKIGEVTIAQIYQGMRGITGLVSETSLLDAQHGISFRGYSIDQLKEHLPTFKPNGEPKPEGLFYLMLLNQLPTSSDASIITNHWQRRSHVPNYVFDTIDALPIKTHPMTMFVVGVMALQSESKFALQYSKGMGKKEYWGYTYDDTMDLIARLPRVAAHIYRRKYKNDVHIQPDGLLDWSGNFAHMLGYDDESFHELMRLYLTIHADHEGGNVSAHTTHLVGSALSDPYLSYAAGMNGLAGPLHGLANQEVVKWIFEMNDELKSENPTKEQIAKYVEKTLEEGKVVPGYGHAVLRKTDPRFTAQMEFAKKYLPNDTFVNIVWKIYEVVPPILSTKGKIKNPWPNVDAHSGSLLLHYGLNEFEFYTVLFAVSRALGVLSSLCWDRALGLSIERPKSVTTNLIKKWLKGEEVSIWD